MKSNIHIPTALLVASFLGIFVTNANAQFSSTVTSQKHDLSFSMGRDFWLAEMSNDWGTDTGSYMNLYITSPKPTTAYIAYAGKTYSLALKKPDSTYTYSIPISEQMESSGYVENKAIHVWSNDAPLIVYNMSHVPYSSDGEYIIPTIGWGTDYVVAAYGSLYEGFSTSGDDLPSTLAVTANEDNTKVDITPSCDCRQTMNGALTGNGSSTVIVYQAGQTYSWTLNRGQDLELMPVKASDPENFDLTGTVIHSSQPVGVFGGSVSPNIPSDFPYDDHVEDMIPPIRSWGKTYYSTNLTQPQGSPDDYTRYLFISSQPGQTIWCGYLCGERRVECEISDQYGSYWDEIESGQKFWSSAPFLCVAYVNSAWYPGGQSGVGDPAETHINPLENFTDTVIFETAPSIGNQVAYRNYVNVIVPISDAHNIFFDGIQSGAICIDDTFEIFTIPAVKPGTHIITDTTKPSHGGIGVFVYGLGYDETYAWSSPEFEGTLNSPDTVPPVATIYGGCTSYFVHLTDSGLLPDGIHSQSGLSMLALDTLYNMNYVPDVPGFIEGSDVDTTGFGANPIDRNQPAYLRLTVYDANGNSSTVTLNYTPFPLTISPHPLDFGTEIASFTRTTLYDTLSNATTDTLPLDTFYLAHGTKGFRIDSAKTGALLPGAERIIKLSFDSVAVGSAYDTLIAGNGCITALVPLRGAGIAVNWKADSARWENVPFPGMPVMKSLTVHNGMTLPIHISSAAADSTEFSMDASQFPFVVPAMSTATLNVGYTPKFSGQELTSLLHITSAEAGERNTSLFVTYAADVASEETKVPIVQSQSDGSLRIVTSNGSLHFELLNILGQTVYFASISGTETVNTNGLPHGIYFWRLTAGAVIQTGKVILGN